MCVTTYVISCKETCRVNSIARALVSISILTHMDMLEIVSSTETCVLNNILHYYRHVIPIVMDTLSLR